MPPMTMPLNDFQLNSNDFHNQLSVHQEHQNNSSKTKNFLTPQQSCSNSNLLHLQTNKSKRCNNRDNTELIITKKVLQTSSQILPLKLEKNQSFKTDELQIKHDEIGQHESQQLYDLQKLRQDQHDIMDLDQQVQNHNLKINLHEIKSKSNLSKNIINNNDVELQNSHNINTNSKNNLLKNNSEQHCCTTNCPSNCKPRNKTDVSENNTSLMINANLSLHKLLKSSLIPFDDKTHITLIPQHISVSTSTNALNDINEKTSNYIPITAFSSALALKTLNSESNTVSSIFANCSPSVIMSTTTVADTQQQQQINLNNSTFHLNNNLKNNDICSSTINNLTSSTFVNSATNQNQITIDSINRNNFSNNNSNFALTDPFSSMQSQWLQSQMFLESDQSVILNSP